MKSRKKTSEGLRVRLQEFVGKAERLRPVFKSLSSKDPDYVALANFVSNSTQANLAELDPNDLQAVVAGLEDEYRKLPDEYKK
ncbi:MAG: hypothetical protein AAB410_02100 [Patescibacteria group bacterium]